MQSTTSAGAGNPHHQQNPHHTESMADEETPNNPGLGDDDDEGEGDDDEGEGEGEVEVEGEVDGDGDMGEGDEGDISMTEGECVELGSGTHHSMRLFTL